MKDEGSVKIHDDMILRFSHYFKGRQLRQYVIEVFQLNGNDMVLPTQFSL